jgi:hypothetical protein
MLSLLAVVFWFIFFSYLIHRIIRKQVVSLKPSELTLAYGAKIVMGCLYGYIFLKYYGGDDTWILHRNGIKEKQMLLDDPYQFFWEFGPSTAIKNGNGFLETFRFYLNDLEYCLQAKTLGIINVISRDNYYVNVVFWNFFLFWGHFWLFKLLVKEFPNKRIFHYLLIFLFPPVIFWLSGLRSDGLIFLSFGLLLFYFHRWLSDYNWKSLTCWIVGFAGMLIFRPAVAILLIPALLSWWLSINFTLRPVLVFTAVYLLSACVFFLSAIGAYNLPAMVTARQAEFMELQGSSYQLDQLEPNPGGFLKVFPQAATNTFVRPYPWEAHGLLQVMTALESILFWVLLIYVIFKHEKRGKQTISSPLVLVFILFGFTLYLFIGYTIPFPGAIVRYKIIGEVCLLAALITFLKPPRSDLRLK